MKCQGPGIETVGNSLLCTEAHILAGGGVFRSKVSKREVAEGVEELVQDCTLRLASLNLK